jgi:hypothetical protein
MGSEGLFTTDNKSFYYYAVDIPDSVNDDIRISDSVGRMIPLPFDTETLNSLIVSLQAAKALITE